MRSLILGGARSGKSALAERIAAGCGDDVVYIATARAGEAGDTEMAGRIAHHRARRRSAWGCIEEPLALAATLATHDRPGRCLLVDCLTLWLSNLLLDADAGRFELERAALFDTLPSLQGEVVLVGNEVGMGVVPLGELSRRFVDENGRLHQQTAAGCERVVLVAAGLPLALKGELP